MWIFFFQAEDGIRDLVRSRGLGDVYKRQPLDLPGVRRLRDGRLDLDVHHFLFSATERAGIRGCLLYTSDAADERSSVDLGGRRIIKKKKRSNIDECNDILVHTSTEEYTDGRGRR